MTVSRSSRSNSGTVIGISPWSPDQSIAVRLVPNPAPGPHQPSGRLRRWPRSRHGTEPRAAHPGLRPHHEGGVTRSPRHWLPRRPRGRPSRQRLRYASVPPRPSPCFPAAPDRFPNLQPVQGDLPGHLSHDLLDSGGGVTFLQDNPRCCDSSCRRPERGTSAAAASAAPFMTSGNKVT